MEANSVPVVEETLEGRVATLEKKLETANTKLKAAVAARKAAVSARDAAFAERDDAVAERDQRVLDEEMRAKRIDIEKLQFKVEAMKKNLQTVDARADERFDQRVAEIERSGKAKVEEALRVLEGEMQRADERVKAVDAQIDSLVAGAQARADAVEEALRMIWEWSCGKGNFRGNAVALVGEIKQTLVRAAAKPRRKPEMDDGNGKDEGAAGVAEEVAGASAEASA